MASVETVVRAVEVQAVGVAEDVGLLRRALDTPEVIQTLSLRGVDATQCHCRAHVEVTNSQQGALGCAAMPLGTLDYIRTAGQGVHEACLAEEGTRVLDAKFADVVVKLAFTRRLVNPASGRVRRKLCSSRITHLSAFGAGYCYLLPVNPQGFCRVSRVAGPLPYVAVAAAVASVFGNPNMAAVDVLRVGEGLYHCVKSDRQVQAPIADYLRQCAAAIREGGVQARIGVEQALLADCGVKIEPVRGDLHGSEESRVAAAVGWLESVGVVFPREAVVDMMVATTAAQVLPPSFAEVKGRARMYELLGDVVMKLGVAGRICAVGGTVQDYSVSTAKQTNENLAALTIVVPLAEFMDCGSLLKTSKARADVVESFVGVVYAYCGVSAAVKVVGALGLMPEVGDPVCMELPRLLPQSAVGCVQQMLRDFDVRGGDPQAFLDAVAGMISRVEH